MIFITKKYLLGSLACIAIMGAQAQSQTQMQVKGLSGVYAGVNIGSTTITDLGSKIGFGGFAGYNFNENIAAEVGAQSLGTFTFDGTVINTSAYNVSILVAGPIDPKFSIYGRLGYGGLKGAVSGAEASTNSALYGVGARYFFDKNLAMRVEYTRYASDAGVFSAGVQYAF